jgi:hypothetical protein
VIAFACNRCGKKLRVKDEYAGQTGQCPACGSQMEIPNHSTEDVPSAPPYQAVAQETDPDDFDTDEREPQPTRPKSRQRRQQDGEWEPGEDVKNHSGADLSGKDDFFVPPPAEIGEVVSATTSLRRGTEPMAPGARLTLAIAVGTVGLIIGLVIAVNLKTPFWQLFWPVVLGGIALGIALLATTFKHNCTYVGQEGVSRFTCSGHREQASEDTFLFADASELRTSQTRHYTNGVYTHTAYNFTWTDVGGRVRFVINGSHKSEGNTPPTRHQFHFATAAERAWTIYLLMQVQAQIKLGGTIYFGLGGKNWVRLGKELIKLHMNGETTECYADEIAQVRIEQGQVQVRRKDAKEGWFSSRGVYKFPYGSLANAQLFIILMSELVGVPIN